MTTTTQELADKLYKVLIQSQYVGWKTVLTGRRLDDTTVTLAGAPVGRTWVRSNDSSHEEFSVNGVIGFINIPYWVGPGINKEYEFKAPLWVNGIPTFGQAFQTLALPQRIDQLLPQNVGEIGIVSGRIGPSVLGGTFIHVEAFSYQGGGRWSPAADGSDDFDVGSFFPSLTSQWGRIGVYFDPLVQTFTAFAGEAFYNVNAFTDGDRALIPAGTYPVGAVIVLNGGSIDNSNTFEIWRLENSETGYLLAGGAVIRTIAGGVLTVGTESVVIIAAETGSADDLDTITLQGNPRNLILLADTGDTITVKNAGAGNVHLNRGIDFALSGFIALEVYHDGTDARDLSAQPPYKVGNNITLRVVTAAGAVTVTTADNVIVVNKTVGATTTVNLPASPATGDTYVIKDGKRDAATNNITLTPAAGNIEGAATYVMNVNGQSARIVYSGVEWLLV